MEFVRITSINDPLFAKMHELLGMIFPQEEVYAFESWAEPLKDETLRVCVAVHEGEVVGATEYRYWPDLRVAMVDFTIVGVMGLGVGRFIWEQREADLKAMAAAAGQQSLGAFCECYRPERVAELSFGGVPAMHPVVRREVLSHMGWKRLDFSYVHPSWEDNGEPVTNLDFCFLSADQGSSSVPASLVVDFLTKYYAVLPNKPQAWHDMVADLRKQELIPLRPL